MPPASTASSSGGAKRMSYMHLAWSLGHLVVLLSTFWVALSLISFHPSKHAYYLAYGGALVSWSIVVYKSLGVPSLSRTYVHRAAMDENVQYLVVAAYWFYNRPIYVTLLPFAIFSTFHSLTFVRTTLLKAPTPVKKDAAGAKKDGPSEGFQAQLSKRIQSWVKRNYEAAMKTVAMIEVVVIMGRITIGAILFQNSFLHPLLFAHFLRLRYYLSPQTRLAFASVNHHIDSFLPKLPPPVANGVNILRDMIIRYSESIISVPAAQQQAGPAGAGAAQARPAAGRQSAAGSEGR